MRLSYKIPFITGLVMIMMIIVNIVAFQYFISELLVEYNDTIAEIEQKNALSPEKLSTILEVGGLPDKKQNEYREVLSELTTISTSLKNISENPTLYIQANTGESLTSGDSFHLSLQGKSIYKTPFTKITSLIANPVIFSKDTPEGKLILSLLYRLLATNGIFLCILIGLYFLWIRKIFSPIHTIIAELNTYIDHARFQNIHYSDHDEFEPLVSTINSLYHSLSLQETIRSNFLSDISHEIRTPITAVRCHLEAIEDGIMEPNKKNLSLLQHELMRLTHITEKIMEYEHLTHDTEKNLALEKFSIKKYLQNIINEYRPQLQKNSQKILIESNKEIPIIMDSGMFTQILHNIFSNFIKYAGKGTTLKCRYKNSPDQWILIFEDNGVGIPENELSLVKEKFYRVDKSRTSDGSASMGIGFSIIEHIVRIHSGYFLLENIPSGGLRISLFIPHVIL